MADGSRTLQIEADAAAAEAAREAKADVLARAVTVESSASLPRERGKKKLLGRRSKAEWSTSRSAGAGCSGRGGTGGG